MKAIKESLQLTQTNRNYKRLHEPERLASVNERRKVKFSMEIVLIPFPFAVS